MDFYRLEEKKGPFSLADATVITVQHITQLNTMLRTDLTISHKKA